MKLFQKAYIKIIKGALTQLSIGIDNIIVESEKNTDYTCEYKKGFTDALSEVKKCIQNIIDDKK